MTKLLLPLILSAVVLLSPAFACSGQTELMPPGNAASKPSGAIVDPLDPTDCHIEETLTLSFKNRFKAVLEEAQAYLITHRKRNAAVVLDLDETLVDNRAYFVVHKRFDATLWDQWISRADAPAIPETLEFVKWLNKKRYHVYFVTGRKEAQRALTEKNLKDMGVEKYAGLYMKPDHYAGSSAANFKVEARKKIEAKGQPVVLILGDQQSDLNGGYGRGFLLPNPIYTIP